MTYGQQKGQDIYQRILKMLVDGNCDNAKETAQRLAIQCIDDMRAAPILTHNHQYWDDAKAIILNQ